MEWESREDRKNISKIHMKTWTNFHYKKSRRTRIIQLFFIIPHSDFLLLPWFFRILFGVRITHLIRNCFLLRRNSIPPGFWVYIVIIIHSFFSSWNLYTGLEAIPNLNVCLLKVYFCSLEIYYVWIPSWEYNQNVVRWAIPYLNVSFKSLLWLLGNLLHMDLSLRI